jgi:hypothetical protein
MSGQSPSPWWRITDRLDFAFTLQRSLLGLYMREIVTWGSG